MQLPATCHLPDIQHGYFARSRFFRLRRMWSGPISTTNRDQTLYACPSTVLSVLWLACIVVNLFRMVLPLVRTSRIERERENICGIRSLLVSHPQKVRLVDDRRGLGVRQHIYYTSTLCAAEPAKKL